MAVCKCSIKIDSISRYNGNNYSVVINTVDLTAPPYQWEVRNNLNNIVASGETILENSILETFQLSNALPQGTYTLKYKSVDCDCSDTRSFVHIPVNSVVVAPKILNATSVCTEDENLIIVSSLAGSNSEVTTIIRNQSNVVLHTRTNNLSYNAYQITANGIYNVTVYDSDNNQISSTPFVVNVTCVGTYVPPTNVCVTYNVINFSEDNITIYYRKCNGDETTAVIDGENSAVLCMLRNSFVDNDSITFTEIGLACQAVCSFEINSAIIEC